MLYRHAIHDNKTILNTMQIKISNLNQFMEIWREGSILKMIRYMIKQMPDAIFKNVKWQLAYTKDFVKYTHRYWWYIGVI